MGYPMDEMRAWLGQAMHAQVAKDLATAKRSFLHAYDILCSVEDAVTPVEAIARRGYLTDVCRGLCVVGDGLLEEVKDALCSGDYISAEGAHAEAAHIMQRLSGFQDECYQRFAERVARFQPLAAEAHERAQSAAAQEAAV